MIELFLIEFILKVKWSVFTPQDAGEKTDYFWEKLFQNSVVWINLDNQLHKYIVNKYVFQHAVLLLVALRWFFYTTNTKTLRIEEWLEDHVIVTSFQNSVFQFKKSLCSRLARDGDLRPIRIFKHLIIGGLPLSPRSLC